jgi:hypothetical protein
MVKKAKPGDGLVHHVVQHLEAGQALADALAPEQDAGHDQRRDAGVHHPVAAAASPWRLAEDDGLEAQHHAQQPQRRQLVPRVSVACCLIR